VDDTDITAWLNEAIDDLAARTGVVEQRYTGTTSGLTISPNAAVERVISLRIDDDVDVAFVDDETWWAWYDSEATPDQTLGRLQDGVIQLYPTPDTGLDWALHAIIIPTHLSAGSDTHELPISFERKMVAYAQSMGKLKEGDLGESDRYMATYEQGLPGVNLERNRQVPGPLNLIPVPGPFDIDADSAHF
jgi:hypothetical protein